MFDLDLEIQLDDVISVEASKENALLQIINGRAHSILFWWKFDAFALIIDGKLLAYASDDLKHIF